jgi:16S rRNA processing protein RimM
MDELAVGFVRGAHGTGGEIKIGSYSGELEHLGGLTEVTLRCGASQRRFIVEQVRIAHREALVKLAGVDDRDEALRLAKCEVWVPRSAAAPCGEDEYYIGDLVGCHLVAGPGADVRARVVAVWESGSDDMLEVEAADGTIYHVPFREPFIGEVDVERRRIELTAPWVLA